MTNHLFYQMKIGDHAGLVHHVGPGDIALFAAVSGGAGRPPSSGPRLQGRRI